MDCRGDIGRLRNSSYISRGKEYECKQRESKKRGYNIPCREKDKGWNPIYIVRVELNE